MAAYELLNFLDRKIYSAFNWSSISLLGNTSIGRAAIFAPFIAQAILISADIVSQFLGVGNILWLYWSLISIFLAQLLYWVFCPELIKRYQTDETRLKSEALSTWTNHDLERLDRNFRRFFYSPEGYSLSFGCKTRDAIELALSPSIGANSPSIDQSADAVLRFYSSLTSTRTDTDIDWEVVRDAYERNPNVLILASSDIATINREIKSRFGRYLRGRDDDRTWKVHALEWHYSVLNKRSPRIILLCGSLYAAGSAYFIYYALHSIVRMVAVTAMTLTN